MNRYVEAYLCMRLSREAYALHFDCPWSIHKDLLWGDFTRTVQEWRAAENALVNS